MLNPRYRDLTCCCFRSAGLLRADSGSTCCAVSQGAHAGEEKCAVSEVERMLSAPLTHPKVERICGFSKNAFC
jgi:hypothetical protein